MRLYFDVRTSYETIKEFYMDLCVKPHKHLYEIMKVAPESLAGVVGRWVGMPIAIFFHLVCIVSMSLLGAIPTLTMGFLGSVKIKKA